MNGVIYNIESVRDEITLSAEEFGESYKLHLDRVRAQVQGKDWNGEKLPDSMLDLDMMIQCINERHYRRHDSIIASSERERAAFATAVACL